MIVSHYTQKELRAHRDGSMGKAETSHTSLTPIPLSFTQEEGVTGWLCGTVFGS